MCKIPIILWIANAAAPARSAAVKVARSMDRSCSAPDCSRDIILSGTSTILPGRRITLQGTQPWDSKRTNQRSVVSVG